MPDRDHDTQFPILTEIEKQWLALVKQRSDELTSGEVQPITWEAMKQHIFSD